MATLRNTGFRVLAAIGLVVALCLIVLSLQACFWTRDYARSQAQAKAIDYCIRTRRDPALLGSPKEGVVGNTVWSFEWIHTATPRETIGVWFARDGHAELYTGPVDEP